MSAAGFTTRDVVYIALFAALTAALSIFPPFVVPMLGVPVTAQSLGPMLAGAVLGARRGGLAILLLLVLVALGLPLLSGGRGGLGVFFGPSAGFMLGWVVGAVVVGALHERFWATLRPVTSFLFCVIGGIVVCYAIGIPWVAVVAHLPLEKVAMGSAVFIPGDLIKAGLAAAVAVTVRRSYPLIRRAA
ncbi:Biotin transporter BioY [Rhodovastum atsumiense]|uniref:Biotin transporter n=1 Tax=Rhodovastum atsumiense TaxID=504468 RepID=A0A5M6ILB1_9PROT|nr:biotin transporter BioY [Rhodovastum atsumiense]KAA5608962.1 biotin biosynthesis protein BioY [Rhodovastum atsumiense]CAH2603693.1 Biotin transporter BioY [Rhodovastum atsumiense]